MTAKHEAMVARMAKILEEMEAKGIHFETKEEILAYVLHNYPIDYPAFVNSFSALEAAMKEAVNILFETTERTDASHVEGWAEYQGQYYRITLDASIDKSYREQAKEQILEHPEAGISREEFEQENEKEDDREIGA